MKNKKLLLVLCYSFLSLISLKLTASSNWHTDKTMLEQFNAIAKDYENSLFDYSPESGLFWGKSNGDHDRFTDYSLDALQKWQQQEDRILSALQQIDGTALKNSAVYTTYLLLMETLENKKTSRMCREELWDINPVWGWHNKMAIVAEKQPIGTAHNRELAIKRWQTFSAVANTQVENLKIGLSQGFTAPKPAVLRVITQIKIILQSEIDESPFFAFARRDEDENFKNQIRHLIKAEVNPGLSYYVNFLENDYLPVARKTIGLSAMPAGSQCYQAKIQQETTVSKTPNEIHDLGIHYLQRLEKEIAEIGIKKYGVADIRTVFRQVKDDPENYFASEKELLNYNFAALERAKFQASAWFDLMPKMEATIKPYPLYRAQTGAAGEYHPPNEDGTEPGIFFINTHEPQKRNRVDQEATLFHELIPGHHFQVALTYENTALPPLNKYLWSSGFGEGWALYVERLADEMGLYKDDISRLGMLSNEALRAARLVVDTGIHAMGWNREKAICFLTQYTSLDKYIIEGEVDRYIMMPGQATAYMLGKYEIEALRDLAKDQLGAQFDIRKFHNQVLKNGSVSLPILRKQIENWLAEEKISSLPAVRSG